MLSLYPTTIIGTITIVLVHIHHTIFLRGVFIRILLSISVFLGKKYHKFLGEQHFKSLQSFEDYMIRTIYFC